eukprot:COSAG01_NODE_53739_length_337_cov_0.609244_1_plen_31_part_10
MAILAQMQASNRGLRTSAVSRRESKGREVEW